MNLSYLKTKGRMWLPILCITSLSTSLLLQSKARDANPSVLAEMSMSSDDRKFISECLQEIEALTSLLDTQIREFFDRTHSDTYQAHLQRLDELTTRIDATLIKPLNERTHKHEVFSLAYEILTELKTFLNDLHATLKRHQSSNLVFLAGALKQLSDNLRHSKISELEKKINRLNALIDGANICKTNQFKNILITLCEKHPLKEMTGLQILDCLKRRLNCR